MNLKRTVSYILVFVVSVVLVRAAYAQFAPQNGEPNFTLTVVDASGLALPQATTLVYKSEDPSVIVCRGYCSGVPMYLEPGVSYDAVAGVLRLKNLKVEAGKKLEKVVRYTRPEVGDDWNLALTITDEQGKPSGVWYTLYRADNPADV